MVTIFIAKVGQALQLLGQIISMDTSLYSFYLRCFTGLPGSLGSIIRCAQAGEHFDWSTASSCGARRHLVEEPPLPVVHLKCP